MLFGKILKEKRVYVFMFILTLAFGCLPTNASAMPASSKAGLSHTTEAYKNDLKAVSRFLEEEAVTRKLAKLGLSSEQIKNKLETMDAYQLHSLATRISSLEKAGDGGSIAIVILALLLVLISFLYLTKRRIKFERDYD